jgi:hypothetical protein
MWHLNYENERGENLWNIEEGFLSLIQHSEKTKRHSPTLST